ncbi:MAG: glycosyltransferase family 2 protein [Sphingomonas sp.]|nr:glycosyltransferase family 2 protein [Sphingomonas sp.]
MRSEVSVIVPTHGRPNLLARALDSIARQSASPREVIIVDDIGCSETRELVAERCRATTTPLRYVASDEPGACRSRNLGASLASGDLIAFLDDDDEWMEGFLDRCSAALADCGADFALADIERRYTGAAVKRLSTRPGLTAKTVLNQRVHMTGSSFVIRSEAFWAVDGFDPAVPVFNDWDLFLRLVRAGKTYRVVNQPLVCWNEHPGERITTPTLRRAEGIDRFLGVYGADMRFHVRAYFLRIAYGIRKANEASRIGRMHLTSRMLRSAGILGSAYIAWRSAVELASKPAEF